MKNIRNLDDCDIMERIDEKKERFGNVGMFIQDKFGKMLDEEITATTPDPRFTSNHYISKKQNDNLI